MRLRRRATSCARAFLSRITSTTPPRRVVSFAQGLDARGASSVVGSICETDYAATIDALLRGIGGRLSSTCPR